MTYILPSENATIADLYVWSATTTDGISSYGILLIVFAVVFFGTQRFGARPQHSLLLSTTATTLIGGALMIMGALSPIVVSILAGLLALTYFKNSQT